jgi:hypothetical protein
VADAGGHHLSTSTSPAFGPPISMVSMVSGLSGFPGDGGAGLHDNLPEGDVTVRVDYSTINYKDGLAITGRRRWCASSRWCPASTSPAR